MEKGKKRLLRTMTLLMLAFLALPLSASAKISISRKTFTLSVGETCQLELNGLTGSETSIEWQVKREAIADITQDGIVTAKANGLTNILAIVDGKKYRCQLLVGTITGSIRLSTEETSLQKGGTLRLKATAEPETSAGMSGSISWKSSNKKVAKVNAKGKVKAIAPGTAKITAYTSDGSLFSAVCKITVTLAPVRLSAAQQNLVVGKKIKLSAISDTGGGTYTWSSSDKTVANVNKSGRVKGKKEGTAVITVRRAEDGSTASCTVIVTSAEATAAQAQAPSQPSAYALQALALMQKYSDQVKADTAAGHRWIYSNTGAKGTWADACREISEKGVSRMNCALGCRWALRDLGLLDSSNFWGEPGYVVYHGTSREQLLQHCDILTVNKTPNELLAEGNLLPGDICTYATYAHTNMYAGNGLWYDCGRSGLTGGYQNGEYVFNSFGPVASVGMSSTKICTIIRIVR